MRNTEVTRSALLRARHVVTLRPERGQRTYSNTASITDGTACTVVEGEHEFVFDVPPSVGGSDAGPSPSVILRSAISSCVAIGIKQWAALSDVDIAAVRVSVDTKVDARGQLGVNDRAAPGFEEIKLNIHVESDQSPTIVKEVIAQSLRYSPLMDTLKHSQTIDAVIHVAEEE